MERVYHHSHFITKSSTMNTFTIVFCALFAAVVATHHHYDHAPAFYKFEYGVHDPHTGDIKSQHEHRDGKYVKGGYSLKEADGTTRVVEYHAGPHSGFNAVVKRIGHAQHPAHYGHVHGGQQGGFGGLGGGYGGHGGSSYVGPTHFGYGAGQGGHYGGYGFY